MGPMCPVPNADGLGAYHGGEYDYKKELQWQIQIGGKMFPEYPCQSLAESFYQLKKAMGIAGSAFHSLDITPTQYRNDKFILGLDTEKVLGASFTGFNTKAGDLLCVRIKPANGTAVEMPLWANSMYIFLQTDNVLEIRDSGILVCD